MDLITPQALPQSLVSQVRNINILSENQKNISAAQVSSFPRPLPIPVSNDSKAISDVVPAKSQHGQRSFSNNHNHTNSTSSNKRLLSPEDSEYIV